MSRGPLLAGHQTRDGFASVLLQVFQIHLGDAQQAAGRLVGQGMGVGGMLGHATQQGGHHDLVKPHEQQVAGCRHEFIERQRQAFMRDLVQTQRRFAHFTHSSPNCTDLLGTNPSLMAPGHLQFINRLGGDPGGQDSVDAAQRVVVPLESTHALLDRQTGPIGLGHGAKTGQSRKVSMGPVFGRERAW